MTSKSALKHGGNTSRSDVHFYFSCDCQQEYALQYMEATEGTTIVRNQEAQLLTGLQLCTSVESPGFFSVVLLCSTSKAVL